jgi:hypothetical protein
MIHLVRMLPRRCDGRMWRCGFVWTAGMLFKDKARTDSGLTGLELFRFDSSHVPQWIEPGKEGRRNSPLLLSLVPNLTVPATWFQHLDRSVAQDPSFSLSWPIDAANGCWRNVKEGQGPYDKRRRARTDPSDRRDMTWRGCGIRGHSSHDET